MNLNWEFYIRSAVEDWICYQYNENAINSPSDLTISNVARAFGVSVNYYEGPPFAEWEEGSYSFIFLNHNRSPEQQRVDFFHELCHPLRHAGKQEEMSQLFRQLQEIQAYQFQMFAALPITMLEQFDYSFSQQHYLAMLSEAFRMPYKIVARRIEQIYHRINFERSERNLRARTTPKPMTYGYSEATNIILEKLNLQLAERGVK